MPRQPTHAFILLLLRHHVMTKHSLGATMSHAITPMTPPCFFLGPSWVQGAFL